MSETATPTAIGAAPHPRAVFKLLKDAARAFYAGATAASGTVNTIANTARTAPLTISGVITVGSAVEYPATVSVKLMQAAVQRYATVTGVGAGGAWSVTVPANTLAIATGYTAVATTTNPATSATSNSFNIT
jgi:hypothetical protein